MVHTFGVDPKTGFARSPWDNVGIQYGLVALNNGVITMDQFIDINTRIGGRDSSGKIVAQREVGDPEALRIAYATGRVNEETGGLASIPLPNLAKSVTSDSRSGGDRRTRPATIRTSTPVGPLKRAAAPVPSMTRTWVSAMVCASSA